MRRIAALCAALTALGGAGTALGHDIAAPTAVVIDSAAVVEPGTVTVSGHLEGSSACVAGRGVRIYARYGEWTDRRHVWAPGDWQLAGATRSAADGEFGGQVAETDLWSVKVEAPRANLGRRGHRHVCRAGGAAIRF